MSNTFIMADVAKNLSNTAFSVKYKDLINGIRFEIGEAIENGMTEVTIIDKERFSNNEEVMDRLLKLLEESGYKTWYTKNDSKKNREASLFIKWD